MSPQIKSVSDASVRGKRVLVRCDFDVPINSEAENQESVIIDDSRLISCISTIEYLLEEGADVIAVGHLGRPKGYDPKLSLSPVAKWFGEQFEKEIESSQLRGFEGWLVKDNFIILENLRFYKGEEENDLEFVKSLGDLADIYVNEAFGVSHRENASIVGVPELLPHFAGFHLIKEIKILGQILTSPKRPLTIIVGGAKIETKLPLISKMHKFADYVLVAGELAEHTKTLAKVEHEKIRGKKAQILVADLNSDKTDITNESMEEFEEIIWKSATVVLNGPMGEISFRKREGNKKLSRDENGYSTFKIAKEILASPAYAVVGGGDTVGFLKETIMIDRFDFISVGGGAMLEFLSGVKLPGLVALGS